MQSFHSPIDPVFWRWHRWIDGVRAAWLGIQRVVVIDHFAMIVRILFGVVNDAPGVVIGPDGVLHHVPGGPGDPVAGVFQGLPVEMQNLFLGQMTHQLGSMVGSHDHAARLKAIGAELMKDGH